MVRYYQVRSDYDDWQCRGSLGSCWQDLESDSTRGTFTEATVDRVSGLVGTTHDAWIPCDNPQKRNSCYPKASCEVSARTSEYSLAKRCKDESVVDQHESHRRDRLNQGMREIRRCGTILDHNRVRLVKSNPL
jgi:hypothetical protein